MARPRKDLFKNAKMLSSRIELSDYIKLEESLQTPYGKQLRIQDILNAFVRSCISGSIQYKDGLFVGAKKEEK